MNCRHCHSNLTLTLVDLGSAPPSNAVLSEEALKAPEAWLPLRVMVCEQCWLVQTEDRTSAAELFNADYPYFSGFSPSWIDHSTRYVDEVIDRFSLGAASHLVEVGANDGSLLEHAVARGIRCTGIEPTPGPAAAARARGIPIIEEFFGLPLARRLAAEGRRADVTLGANVLAHVPDINEFVAAFAVLLAPGGVASFEFPHLLNLVAQTQFDTIYHEHFSYLSLTAVEGIFAANGLSVFDVQPQPTHGGSLRVFAQRADHGKRQRTTAADELLEVENQAGVRTPTFYAGFQKKVDAVKNDFLSFLLEAKADGKTAAGYGAAAKANTLLNYAGVRRDLVSWVADRNPAKQGKFMPGSRIPIVSEECLRQVKPDFVILFPWNLEAELTKQLEYIGTWGGRFVMAIPELRVTP